MYFRPKKFTIKTYKKYLFTFKDTTLTMCRSANSKDAPLMTVNLRGKDAPLMTVNLRVHSSSSLACPVIWGRGYSCLSSFSILSCVLSSFSPASVISVLHAPFHHRFGYSLLLFPGMSTSSNLLTMCSSFIRLTWQCHFSRFL